MRRIDLLIQDARVETDNTAFTDETGIQDSEFLRWANSAQNRIISLIQQAHPDLLQRESIITAVQGQESYDIPSRTFLGTRVQMVEYSRTGQIRDLYPLKKGNLHERINGDAGDPAFYIRLSKKFLVQPRPQSTGIFRVISQLALPRLDIRRATVASAVLDTVNRTITSLTLDTTVDIDDTQIRDEGYITIVDRDGNIKMQSIPVSDVNTTSGAVTIIPGFVYAEGETIPAGSFVCLGEYSSTQSELPDIAEKYLVDFMIWKVEKRDSNTISQEISQELKDQEQEIVDAFALADDDVSYVAILDPQYLDYDEYY